MATGTDTTSAGAWYGLALVLGLVVQLVGLLLVWPILVLAGLLVGAGADLVELDEGHELRGRLRRAGLGVLVRTALRSLPMVAVAALAGAPVLVVVLAIGVVLVVVVAGRGVVTAFAQVGRDRPASGVRNLGVDLPLSSVLDRVERWRVRAAGAFAGLEVPLGIGLWLAARGAASSSTVGEPGPSASLAVGWVLVAAVGVVAAGSGAWWVWWTRRLRRSGRIAAYRQQLAAELEAHGAEVIVYFSGDPDATYQLRQWMPVFEALDRDLLLVLRELIHLDSLPDTRHPVLFCRTHRDVEDALAADPKVALYVGTAGRNIHLLRYGRLRHVFLNHGDSDKVSSANPVVKVYDELYVAGELAIERYEAAGIEVPRERFSLVGRPQLDAVRTGRQRIGDGPTTLLYAPTWEGYFDAADYSSLERMGVALVRALLAVRPDLRIVFKPHPLSGFVKPAAAAAGRQVTALLREAGGSHVIAADQPDVDLLAWFDRCDVLVSDISAVVTDFLQTDKPYLVTNPRGLEHAEFHARFPSHTAAYVIDLDLAELPALLTAATGEDPQAAARAEMKRRVLGEHPDGPLATFAAALDATVARAEGSAARIRNTFAYD